MSNSKGLFLKFAEDSLQNVLSEFKTELIRSTGYKYAINNKDRIRYLKKIKNDYIPVNVNISMIKGVKYSEGKLGLIESEIDELIKYYGVNIEDIEYGLFNNPTDNSKPLGWRSSSMVICCLDYCLRLQIINEIISDLKQLNFKNPDGNLKFLITDQINSEVFFNYIVDNWLSDEPHKLTALKHITFKMLARNNFEDMPFKIICTLTDFAEHWNKNYSHILTLSNIKNPKLNECDTTRDNRYDNKLKTHLIKFTGVGIP